MDIRIKSAILGALLGGAITYVVGPVITHEVEKRLNDSDWAGIWQTVTCREGQPERAWEMRLEQQGNRVTGVYAGAMERNKDVDGQIEGTVSVTRFEGSWKQLTGAQVNGGELTLLLDEETGTFKGTYLNEQAGTFGRWKGARGAAGDLGCP